MSKEKTARMYAHSPAFQLSLNSATSQHVGLSKGALPP